METYDVRPLGPDVRVRWVVDSEYRSADTWALDTDEETAAAVADEEAALNRGDLVALGAIVEHRCGACGEWKRGDALWGIVIEPDGATRDAFARSDLVLKPE